MFFRVFFRCFLLLSPSPGPSGRMQKSDGSTTLTELLRPGTESTAPPSTAGETWGGWRWDGGRFDGLGGAARKEEGGGGERMRSSEKRETGFQRKMKDQRCFKECSAEKGVVLLWKFCFKRNARPSEQRRRRIAQRESPACAAE